MNKNAIWIISAVALVVCVGIFGAIQGWWTSDDTDDNGDENTGDNNNNFAPDNNNGNNDYVPPYTPPETGDGSKVPVESLAATAKNKFTMAADTDGDIKFYETGADVSDPYVLALDNIDFSSGTTTNLVIQTNENYDVYYVSDGATNYDEKVTGWQINYNPETGKGYLLIGGVSYFATSPVGAFSAVDTLPEVQSGMDETGQYTNYLKNVTLILNTFVSFADTTFPTSDSCATPNAVYNASDMTVVAAGNYSITACTINLTNATYDGMVATINYTKTTNDFLRYDESSLGGSGWFQVDIGNTNANTEIRDFVLCFRDADGDMDGNEITSFTASYVSGTTSISIPGSLQTYWEDAMGTSNGASCVKIADVVGGAQLARWEFSMTTTEANWDTTEEFEMTFDDLGGYLDKQYPSRSAKATAKTLYIGNQA